MFCSVYLKMLSTPNNRRNNLKIKNYDKECANMPTS